MKLNVVTISTLKSYLLHFKYCFRLRLRATCITRKQGRMTQAWLIQVPTLKGNLFRANRKEDEKLYF